MGEGIGLILQLLFKEKMKWKTNYYKVSCIFDTIHSRLSPPTTVLMIKFIPLSLARL